MPNVPPGAVSTPVSGLGERAEGVRLVDARVRRVDVRRTSGRSGQSHDVGGAKGEATYAGEAIGALIHVGRHAAFGNGGFTVLD